MCSRCRGFEIVLALNYPTLLSFVSSIATLRLVRHSKDVVVKKVHFECE